jgi:putative PIN family toxin of toxin-antitoxin system
MQIVLDTNVLVSGLLSPFSFSGEILRLITAGDLKLYYDSRILLEYKDVLLRAKFGFSSSDVDDLLSQIESEGFSISGRPLPKNLPDTDDEAFLEIAIAGKAYCLVTGNIKHYPIHLRQGMLVLSPAEFLEKFRKKS